VVVDNPTTEADMKLVGDFVNTLAAGALEKNKSQLTKNMKGWIKIRSLKYVFKINQLFPLTNKIKTK
jgi:hypothetical protein